ncbi:mechanosensitive ion channel family protein [Massilia sp. G4R7]|uniref:Mechanosensitive ion channel family protein n=1 Tax=Massilia phyllostachyos TaxID=2898585 RepID=A0ABS8Q7D3_9BURK|nr:mechanosensitive ion channel family protein [Massilia phyllostachyos]MCD2516967.1 mechanosensitive ion channel family protein [Massilia phyllostachyos]
MHTVFLGNPLSDWLVALVAVAVVAAGLDAIKAILLRRLSRLVMADPGNARVAGAAVAALSRTHLAVLVLVGLYAGAALLVLPEHTRLVLSRIAVVAVLVQCAVWGDHAVRAWLAGTRARQAEDPDRVTSAAAIAFLLRVALWAVLALMILDNLGVNITTLVASLGIGGIAIALAVQSILGDLFASLSIVLDKPFVVGDFIIVDTMLGTVERIGLKTTRVRSLGGEQIVFSNADLLKSRIQNLRRMEARRVVFRFDVTYATPEPVLRELPTLVEGIVTAQPQVRFDRAHLASLAAPGYTFETVYYVDSADYRVFMDTQQEIYLRIVAMLEQRDVRLALPAQAIHLAEESASVALRQAA